MAHAKSPGPKNTSINATRDHLSVLRGAWMFVFITYYNKVCCSWRLSNFLLLCDVCKNTSSWEENFDTHMKTYTSKISRIRFISCKINFQWCFVRILCLYLYHTQHYREKLAIYSVFASHPSHNLRNPHENGKPLELQSQFYYFLAQAACVRHACFIHSLPLSWVTICGHT